MNVPTITMPRVEAAQKAAAYGRAVQRSKDPALAAAEAGYAALARGKTLLDLNLAVAAGGWTPEGHPRFAVARTGRREVRYGLDGWRLRFDASERGNGGPSLRRVVLLSVMPPQSSSWRSWRSAKAMVPTVPPDVREQARAVAIHPHPGRGEFVLWEAVWTALPPRDPILLQHVAGSLYVVLAQWDLTELERSIMVSGGGEME